MARDKKISVERAHDITIDSLPLGTICTAEQVANVVIFLASARGGYVNGAHILLDGGQRKALMDV